MGVTDEEVWVDKRARLQRLHNVTSSARVEVAEQGWGNLVGSGFFEKVGDFPIAASSWRRGMRIFHRRTQTI